MHGFLRVTIILIPFIYGCSSSNTTKIALQSTMTTEKSSLPNWLHNPNKENYICGIGSSELTSKENITKKTAFITAKAHISEQIKVYVDT